MTDKNELPDGGLSKSTAKRVEVLAAASVSERARELVRRAYEVVHHDDECPAIGGCGDKDCRCDAVPFLRELESLISGGSHA